MKSTRLLVGDTLNTRLGLAPQKKED